VTIKIDCEACGGNGSTFTDEWGSSGHYTIDTACSACHGTGNVEVDADDCERCKRATPGDELVHDSTVTDRDTWICPACMAVVIRTCHTNLPAYVGPGRDR
jgi:hypothetical protein